MCCTNMHVDNLKKERLLTIFFLKVNIPFKTCIRRLKIQCIISFLYISEKNHCNEVKTLFAKHM